MERKDLTCKRISPIKEKNFNNYKFHGIYWETVSRGQRSITF